jgi:hypothetical protein
MISSNKGVKKFPRDQLKTKKKVKYTRKIWTGSKPPADNTEAYKSCGIRIANIDKQLNELDVKYKIDDANLIDTIKFYGYHLERLRIAEGLTDFKSARAVTEILNSLKSQGLRQGLPMLKSTRMEIINKNDEKLKESEQTRSELSKLFELEPAKNSSDIRLPSINMKDKHSKSLTLTKITLTQKINLEEITTKEKDDEEEEEEVEANKDEDENKETNNETNETSNEPEQEEAEKADNDEVKSELYESDDNLDDLNFDGSEIGEKNDAQVENKRKIDIPLTPMNRSAAVSPTTQENKKALLIEKLKLVDEDSKILRELYEKTMDAFKNKYSLLIDEVDMLCMIFEKYFVSFMQNNFDNLKERFKRENQIISTTYLSIIEQLLETGFKYNVKTREFGKLIHEMTSGLRTMRRNFEENAVLMRDFSSQVQRLSMRYDCDLIPLVFILYEFSLKIKACTKTLKDWLMFEQSYTSYLQNDLKMIGERKKSLGTLKLTCESIYNHIMSKKNLIKKSVENYEKELDLSYKKKEEKLNQMFSSRNDENDQESLEEQKALLKMQRKKRIPKKYFKYQKLNCYEMLKNSEFDLNQLENEFARISDNIKSSRAKNSFEQIQENTDQIRTFKIKLENLEEEVIHLFEEKRITNKELDLLENCCAKIKEIQMYKSCSQTLDKLFHNVKLPCLKFGGPKTTLDEIIRPSARDQCSPVMLGTMNTSKERDYYYF